MGNSLLFAMAIQSSRFGVQRLVKLMDLFSFFIAYTKQCAHLLLSAFTESSSWLCSLSSVRISSSDILTLVEECWSLKQTTLAPIWHDLDLLSYQLMEVGAHGQCGRTAQPHAVQGHSVELVNVTIQSPRMEATVVAVNQVPVSHVMESRVQVCLVI